MSEKARIGWYSAKGETLCGSNWWMTEDDREVLVSAVLFEGSEFSWDDKVCLGPVKHWIRPGERGCLVSFR